MNGYVKIPGSINKAPLVKFAAYQGDKRELPPDFSNYANDVWLLLLSSHQDPNRDLVVVDVDDMAHLPWAIETFGETPYTVATSRGMHLYYKAGGEKVISRNGMVHAKVDVKSWGAYVVAPGSKHRSGFTYTASGIFDFDALPLFDNAKYEALCREARELRRMARITTTQATEGALNKGAYSLEGVWKAWSQVTLFDGRTLSQVKTGEHIVCPFHPGDGERTMYVYDGGREAYCFKESKTFYNLEAPKFIPWVGPWRSGAWTTVSGEPAPMNGKRLGDLTDAFKRGRVVIVKVGRGAGKTYQAVELAKQETGTVVAVSPTRSLTRSLSTRFGIVNYQDVDNENSQIKGSVAVCTPSIWRSEQVPGLLVLDEIEQQVRSLAGTHLLDLDARRAWESLIRRIQVAERVLMLDADAGPGTLALLHAAGVVSEAVWLEGPVETPREWVKLGHKADLTEYMTGRLKAGERLALYSQSRRLASGLARAWERKGFKVACITAHTASEYDLREFSWLKAYDAVIYTPLLGTGVSIDVPFDRVCAVLAQNVGTWDDLRQAVARVRTVKHSEVTYWGPMTSPPEPADCNTNNVLRTWIKHRDSTPSRYTFRYILTDDYTSVSGSQYTAAMATVMAYDVSQGSGWLTRAVEAFANVQAPISEEHSEDSMNLANEVKAVKREEAEAIVASVPLDASERQRLERHGPANVQEADRLRREHIVAFYGEDYTDADKEAQLELVLADDDGRRRQKLGVLRDIYTDPNVLQELDEVALSSGRSGLRYQSRGLRAAYYKALLAELGGIGAEVSTDVCAKALGNVRVPVGVKVPKSTGATAVGNLVRSAGLVWKRTKKLANRQWGYRIGLPTDIPKLLQKWGVSKDT
ncbi:MAG: bifunctional DNA primase/polymerase [Thiotrichales bacterium]|nr:bifunctional DNA primase/polymerase [Thiotrichales bacterium]